MQNSNDIEMQPIGHYSSLVEKLPQSPKISYNQLIRKMMNLIWIDVKTLTQSHYEVFKQTFVNDLKWVKESHYNQTLDLVETIPGATTIQIVVAIGTFSTNAIGGLLALFFYALPSALILLALGLWFREYEYKDMNILIQIALYGIRSANVALIVQVCFKMIWDHVENRLDAGLVVMSAVAVLLFPNPQTLLTMLVIGGLLMLMLEYNIENREDKSEDNHEEPIIKEPKYVVLIHETINTKNCGQLSAMFGSKALHMYIIIWMLILWFHGQALDQSSENYFIWELVVSFYRIGTFLIGGTPIMLPFLFSEITTNNLSISEDAMWIGFALAAAVPGPYLNFAIFLAAHTGGLEAAIACWLVIYIPSILQIWGLLPHWTSLKQSPYFNKFFEGVYCVSIGFLVATSYFAWLNATKFDMQTSTIISVLSLIYIVMLNFNSTGVMVFGGTLFVIRYLALWYYRKIDPALA